ncbi:MAG TPA: NTP transferase domain-containing protein [Chloroflexota bacterium]|nr:NTP transferase domain-containing protein [Chloroflexota bacterium]
MGAVVLAAGKGTRMGSPTPKVLQPLLGRAMIDCVLDQLEDVGFSHAGAPAPVMVVGFGAETVRAHVGDRARFVVQEPQLGTGDAVAAALRVIPSTVRTLLVVHGDEPLIEASSYREMLLAQGRTGADVALLTGSVYDTQGLGRVIRDGTGAVVDLVQEAELSSEQRRVREINFGAYVFSRAFLQEGLRSLHVHPGGEYYLTDLIPLASRSGREVQVVTLENADERMGVNDPHQLARAERLLREQGMPAAASTGPA